MASAQQQEVIEPGPAAVSPMPHVVRVAIMGLAAGKPAPMVPGRQRAPDGRRDGPGLATDVQHRAIAVMAHDHSGSVACDAAGRFRGDANAVLQRRLARGVVVRQRLLVDMNDDLIEVPRRAAVEMPTTQVPMFRWRRWKMSSADARGTCPGQFPMAMSSRDVRIYQMPSTSAGEASVRAPMSLVCSSSNSGPVRSTNV